MKSKDHDFPARKCFRKWHRHIIASFFNMLKQKLTNRIIVRKYLGGAPHTAVLNFASMENIILSVITVSITGHMTENKVDVVLRSHLVAVFNPIPGQTLVSRKDLKCIVTQIRSNNRVWLYCNYNYAGKPWLSEVTSTSLKIGHP